MSTSNSSLYRACYEGSKGVVEGVLSQTGLSRPRLSAAVYMDPTHGDTPLHQATKQGWLDIVKLLIEEYGCDPNVRSKSCGQNPLHYACRYGHIMIVKYLIREQRLNPQLKDDLRFEPLDHALKNNNIEIAVFLCQNCISSKELLNPSRIVTTVNLISNIVTFPELITADGDSIFKLVGDSKLCISHMPSALVLKVLDNTSDNKDGLFQPQPDWKTADGDILIDLMCQSKMYLSAMSAKMLHEWLKHATIDVVVKKSLPDSKTADDIALIQIVCASEMYVSRVSSINLSKWLGVTTLDLGVVILALEWKTADGYTLLELVYDSKTILSRINPAVLSKWKTTDGYTLLQLMCMSQKSMLQVSLAVLSKWIQETTLDLDIQFAEIIPMWKTADPSVFLLHLVCQSESCLSRISSLLFVILLRMTPLHCVNISLPDSRTADGDTIIQLVFLSDTFISRIFSKVLSKLLYDTKHDLVKLIVSPDWRTADGDTLFELICQLETWVSNVSSAVFVKWLKKTNIKFVTRSIPDCRTVDGDTILELVIQSENSMLQISSIALLKWLSHSSEITIDQMKSVDPNWNTLDGDGFLHVLCQSKIEDRKVIELLKYYEQVCILNPDMLDSKGNTALHNACQADKPALVSYLLFEAQCHPCIRNKMESLPLDMTVNPEIINYCLYYENEIDISKTVIGWLNKSINISEMKSILKVLKDNYNYTDILHIIVTCNARDMFHDQLSMVDYLLDECHTDPNSLDSKRLMPIQLTSNFKIIKKLVEHGAKMTADVVFKVILSKYINDSEARKLFMLTKNMLWKPNDLHDDGETALHLACLVDKPDVVSYLLTEVKCDPNANNVHSESPIEITTSLEIAKMLIQHGARITPGLVLRFEAMETDPMFKHKLIELMLTTWNANDKDSDGYTALHLACIAGNATAVHLLLTVADCNPNIVSTKDGYTALHLACKADSPSTVNILLSIAHCDPNIKSSNEEVPLQITTNSDIIKDLIRYGAKTSIMYKSYKNTLRTSEPVQPPVKVFVVGNPSVGKSSLTAALKKKIRGVARLFTSGRVSGVDQMTAGIVPHEVESDIFGKVTLYDFAGHREFYSGHAALLQTAIQSTPPIFLLVVNLYADDNTITENIMYWISFLENQCASVNCMPHVILVGSHADLLKSQNDAKDKIKRIVYSQCVINMKMVGSVAMDCQYHESLGMKDLRFLLNQSCNELRIHEPITFNAHCFLVYLIDTFENFQQLQ